MIKRRKTRSVKIGDVGVGGQNPISIQSMTKTHTKDVTATVKEIKRLEKEGCEIIRVAVPDKASAEAIGKIKSRIKIPLICDIHFNYRLALASIEHGADAIRLNPGNINRKEHIEAVVKKAKKEKISIRVGVNSGSLNGPGNPILSIAHRMVQSALNYVKILEDLDFYDTIVSLKASDVPTTIGAYRWMASHCDYPFHLGVTATGLPGAGLVKSAVGIGSLLNGGIGDTIRVSLTAGPVEEVRAAKLILGSLELRRFGPEIISCPTCGRCEVDLVKIAKEVEKKMHSRMPLKVAIMGCVVNGPGEARDADIGIACGRRSGMLFRQGKKVRKVKESKIVAELLKEIKKL